MLFPLETEEAIEELQMVDVLKGISQQLLIWKSSPIYQHNISLFHSGAAGSWAGAEAESLLLWRGDGLLKLGTEEVVTYRLRYVGQYLLEGWFFILDVF